MDWEFHLFDLDLDAMTLVIKINLDIVKMCVYNKNEVPGSKHIARKDTHTDTD